MALSDIVAVRSFGESSPPPKPMVVSVWATDIYCETAPVPSAHHNIPRFIAPPVSVPTNPAPSKPAPSKPAPAKPAPPKPTQTLRVDIPPSVTDTTGIAGSSAASVHESPPTSPLTDLTESGSDSETPKIQCLTQAGTIPLPDLFPDWSDNRMKSVQEHDVALGSTDCIYHVQEHIKRLAKIHLIPTTNFSHQNKGNLEKFYNLMNAECPFLKEYEKNWATIRLLQAHLKLRTSSQKNSARRKALQAVSGL
ncbi:hypothetical protein B0H14DRAFT_2570074 [Mycena olivaceomarginata]|nr:hypothetical protein B0H14DRAFT_2570074 [Mycena olivaceomarginata]